MDRHEDLLVVALGGTGLLRGPRDGVGEEESKVGVPRIFGLCDKALEAAGG